MSESHARRLTITEDLVRAYSRRGNYHSDAATSEQLGLPGLVAQGMQALGPAYGLLLDAWGDDFLAHGEVDVRFVGLVMAGDTVDAHVEIDGGDATLTVENATSSRTAAIGTARISP